MLSVRRRVKSAQGVLVWVSSEAKAQTETQTQTQTQSQTQS